MYPDSKFRSCGVEVRGCTIFHSRLPQRIIAEGLLLQRRIECPDQVVNVAVHTLLRAVLHAQRLFRPLR